MMIQKIPTILEPEMALRVAEQIRSRHAPLFALADHAHGIGVEVFHQLDWQNADKAHLIAGALYGRILTCFQSICVLTERGLCGDARTLIRALAESAIVLGALVKEPTGVVKLLVARHIVNDRKILGAWLNEPQMADHMSPEQRKRYKKRLEESLAQRPDVKRDPVDIEQLARSCGMLWLYTTAYRWHSGDAAHTSLLALERHVKSTDTAEIAGLQVGSNPKEVRDTLSNALVPVLNATHTVTSFFDLTHYHEQIDEALENWKALTGSGGLQSIAERLEYS